ncbi:MAG: STAUR_1299 family protein [Myxococcota bacterium]
MKVASWVDLKPVLGQSFYVAPASKGTAALAEAGERFRATHGPDRFNYELVAPAHPDAGWLENVMRRLAYHCHSLDVPVPECAGVFVSVFYEDRMYAVTAKTFLETAAMILDVDLEDLALLAGAGEKRDARPV